MTTTISQIDTVDNKMNQIFINLKILSNIKEFDKLQKTGEHSLEIDHAGYLQFARRWWNGRSRADTLLFLKEFIFKDAFKLIDDTLENELEHRKEGQGFYFRESNHNILQKFLHELKNTIKGLQNLKITYSTDITFKSELDIIIEEIELRIEKIKEALKINVSLPLRNGKVRADAKLDK